MSEIQTKNTGLKKLISTHSREIAKVLGVILLLFAIIFAVGLAAAHSDAANVQIVSSKEMQENSAKWHELQTTIDKKNAEISRLTDEKNIAIDEQREVEDRNKLLRQVFTMGKNQK